MHGAASQAATGARLRAGPFRTREAWANAPGRPGPLEVHFRGTQGELSADRKPGRGRGLGAGDARSRPPREAHTSFVKTVRLVSAPVVLELQKQLDTLTPKIATIVGQVRHPAVRPPS